MNQHFCAPRDEMQTHDIKTQIDKKYWYSRRRKEHIIS